MSGSTRNKNLEEILLSELKFNVDEAYKRRQKQDFKIALTLAQTSYLTASKHSESFSSDNKRRFAELTERLNELLPESSAVISPEAPVSNGSEGGVSVAAPAPAPAADASSDSGSGSGSSTPLSNGSESVASAAAREFYAAAGRDFLLAQEKRDNFKKGQKLPQFLDGEKWDGTAFCQKSFELYRSTSDAITGEVLNAGLQQLRNVLGGVNLTDPENLKAFMESRAVYEKDLGIYENKNSNGFIYRTVYKNLVKKPFDYFVRKGWITEVPAPAPAPAPAPVAASAVSAPAPAPAAEAGLDSASSSGSSGSSIGSEVGVSVADAPVSPISQSSSIHVLDDSADSGLPNTSATQAGPSIWEWGARWKRASNEDEKRRIKIDLLIAIADGSFKISTVSKDETKKAAPRANSEIAIADGSFTISAVSKDEIKEAKEAAARANSDFAKAVFTERLAYKRFNGFVRTTSSEDCLDAFIAASKFKPGSDQDRLDGFNSTKKHFSEVVGRMNGSDEEKKSFITQFGDILTKRHCKQATLIAPKTDKHTTFMGEDGNLHRSQLRLSSP